MARAELGLFSEVRETAPAAKPEPLHPRLGWRADAKRARKGRIRVLETKRWRWQIREVL